MTATGPATPTTTAPHAPTDAADWLRAHRWGTTAAVAGEFTDSLPPVSVDAMLGRWHGAGWHTGHPWDGLLEAYGWYGKEFLDPDRVRPLLFRDAAGDPQPVPPGLAPVGLINRVPDVARHAVLATSFRLVRPLIRAGRPAGRLRMVEHHGTPTAALVYDSVPIIDAFRRVDDDLVVGSADIRGQRSPLLFVLRRSTASQRGPHGRPLDAVAP